MRSHNLYKYKLDEEWGAEDEECDPHYWSIILARLEFPSFPLSTLSGYGRRKDKLKAQEQALRRNKVGPLINKGVSHERATLALVCQGCQENEDPAGCVHKEIKRVKRTPSRNSEGKWGGEWNRCQLRLLCLKAGLSSVKSR